MKKIIVAITIGVLALTSCTSSKNGLALKRKYNKGYYVEHHKNSNDATKQNNIDKTTLSSDTRKVIESIAVLPPINTLVAEQATTVHYNTGSEKTSKPNIGEVKHNTILSDSKNATASAKQTPLKTKHAIVKMTKKAKSSSGDSDVRLVLLVILSLFPILALIAMYLKDGNKVTLNFWVDLILHLTFIGYIIFALLVVFDVVNLA